MFSACLRPSKPGHSIETHVRPVFDLQSTINLKQVSSEFTISCQMNSCLRQLPKEPDHLIGNRFRPVPTLPLTINLERRAFLDFAVSCQTKCLRQHQKEPVNLGKSIKFKNSKINFSMSSKKNLYLRTIGSV